MLWGGHKGGLELRKTDEMVTLSGRFPYNSETTLYDGGRGIATRKEKIEGRAFASRIDAGDDVHLLYAHDFDKPIASRGAGTLDLFDGEEALEFEARISSELQSVSYVKDFLTALEARLVTGISPGFRLSNDQGAESVRSEGGAIVRSVKKADLFELSAVTRPAYPQAQIEARNWNCAETKPVIPKILNKWRL